jgi:CSLREA domain-containing protein
MKKTLGFVLSLALSGLALGLVFGLASTSRGAIAAATKSASQGEITVNTLQDEQENDGNCSLREALVAANTNQPVDACLAGSVLTDTITFNVAGVITVSSQLSVTTGGPLIIDGGGVITTSGGGTTRVWWVEANSVLTLTGMAVVDGFI